MYYYIKGTVAHIEPGLAVIDAGGVGYACHTSHATAGRIEINTKATLYTYLHVREDIMDLYGFADTEELACFKMLIGISGVGPKAALAILSAVAPNELALAIVTGDEKPFLAAPGVGKKLAARIILELKDKVAKEQIALADAGLAATIPACGAASEASAALAVLGYSKGEISEAMRGLDLEGLEVSDIVKSALSALMR
ncbi:MAG: Holliday junction branch migration protein RuvA [Clostridia bacterium]